MRYTLVEPARTCLTSITVFVNNQALPLHPLPPPPPWLRTLPHVFNWGSQSLSPGGAWGGPGEACVKLGGDTTTLGAYAPTRGASPKTSMLKRGQSLVKVLKTWSRTSQHACSVLHILTMPEDTGVPLVANTLTTVPDTSACVHTFVLVQVAH